MADIFLKITLKSEYTGSGSNPGPFTIVAQPGGKTFNNVTKESLAAGHYIQVPDTVTGGTITATGVCTNSIPWLAPSTGTANCSSVLGFGTIDATCVDNNTKTNFKINVTGNGTSPVELSYNNNIWLSADAGTTNQFTITGISNDGNNFTFKVRLKNCTTEFTKTISKCVNIATLCQTQIGWGTSTRSCDYVNDTTTFLIKITGTTATTPIQFSKDGGATWDEADTNKFNEKTYVVNSTTTTEQQYFKARIKGCTLTTDIPKSPIDGNLTKCLTVEPDDEICSNQLSWDEDKNTSDINTTTMKKTFNIYVKGNKGYKVLYSLDNNTYNQPYSTSEYNRYKFDVDCTSQSNIIDVYAKIDGCNDVLSGKLDTFCSTTTGQYKFGVDIRGTGGGKLTIGTDEYKTTSIIYRNSASLSLSGAKIEAYNNYKIVKYVIMQGILNVVKTVNMLPNTTSYTIDNETLTSNTSGNILQYILLFFEPISPTGTPAFTLTKQDSDCTLSRKLIITGTPGSKVAYSDSTITNGCSAATSTIGSDGKLEINLGKTNLNIAKTYTVRVYNSDCKDDVYLDKSITFSSINCDSIKMKAGNSANEICNSGYYDYFVNDTCITTGDNAYIGCVVYTDKSKSASSILTKYSLIKIGNQFYWVTTINGTIREKSDTTCENQTE